MFSFLVSLTHFPDRKQTCTAASKSILKFYQHLWLVDQERSVASPLIRKDVTGCSAESLVNCVENYFSTCIGSALAIIRNATEEIQFGGKIGGDQDESVPLIEACESLMEDISRLCSRIAAVADDPSPALRIAFEGNVTSHVTIKSSCLCLTDISPFFSFSFFGFYSSSCC